MKNIYNITPILVLPLGGWRTLVGVYLLTELCTLIIYATMEGLILLNFLF